MLNRFQQSQKSHLVLPGWTDYVFLFDSKKLLETFGPVKDKQCVKVTLKANLFWQEGSTLYEGVDYVVINKK